MLHFRLANPMNKLFYGDNLDVMRKFIRDETVDLCYIDPPFNSKRNYNQIYNNIGTEDRAQAQAFTDTWTWDDHANQCYDDILTNKNGVQTQQSMALINGLEKVLHKGSLFAYIVAMTVRIGEIHRVLKPTGSFYLHCDPTASHYLKLVCDALFVTRGGDYKNEISWKRTSGRKAGNQYGRIHDIIFFYTKLVATKFKPPQVENEVRGHDVIIEDGKSFRLSDLSGAGAGPSRIFEGREIPPPNGRHWMYDQPQIDDLLAEGKIVFNRKGAPRLKKFVEELNEMSVGDLWTDIEPINAAAAERLGYPTQKPEALLERVIEASSNEGDLVLDAFCGCGTTAAVSDRLKRQWIGIDITYQSIALILKRLKDHGGQAAIDGVELHGVPKDMESVDALIHKKDDRVRKEFEKWAILTYSDNRAVINEKKGADKGIDGVAYTRKSKDEISPVLISVKSGKNVGVSEVRDLFGVVESEGAVCGIYITRNPPTSAMTEFAKQQGQFKPEMFQPFDRLQIVTIQQILDGERINLPLMEEVTKKAQKAKKDDQPSLLGE